VDLIPLDGAQGEGGGQVLRTALSLSAVTGQGFRVDRIRAKRLRPGLRPQHLAAVRAAAMSCGAEVHGAFDGSPDLRFAPGPVVPGDFRFDIGTAGAATLVLQAVLPILATAAGPSRVEVTGGTHVSRSPSHHFLARHWSEVVGRLGLVARLRLERAGFFPRGEGCAVAEVGPWERPATLDLSRRGALVAVRGISGAARLRGDVARRAADAARAHLWEQRRMETEWEVVDLAAASPGAFLQVEAVGRIERMGRVGAHGVGEGRDQMVERIARERHQVDFCRAELAHDPHEAFRPVVRQRHAERRLGVGAAGVIQEEAGPARRSPMGPNPLDRAQGGFEQVDHVRAHVEQRSPGNPPR